MLKQICQKILFELKTLQNNGDDFLSAKVLERIATSVYQKFLEQPEHSATSADDVWKVEIQKNVLEIRTNQKEEIPKSDDDVWIFGYGSLVWKADFPFIDRRRGYITGYQRHFFQHSIDHRGIPSKPGRVVTLEPTHKLEDRVYGMAYRIASRHKEDVLQHLDYREKNGYERCVLPFYEFGTEISFEVIMYIATAENQSYAGDVWQLSKIADQIFTSAGPSGPNREYLYHLAEAMRVLFPGVKDPHLYDLEAEVLKRQKIIEPKALESFLVPEIKSIFQDKLRTLNDDEECDSEECLEEIVKEIEDLKKRCGQPGWKEAILARVYLKQDVRM